MIEPGTASVPTYARTRLRDRNRCSETIGCAARRSTPANTANSTTAPATHTSARSSPRPCSAARASPYTRAAAPTADSSAPATSKRPGLRRVSVIATGPSTRISTPSGTFSSRPHRHELRPDSVPASSRPPAVLTAPAAVHTAIARLRGAPSSNMLSTRASPLGAASAAPMPWTTRIAVSSSTSDASPRTAAAAVNRATPVRNTRRRPRMSPALPPSSSRPPKASR